MTSSPQTQPPSAGRLRRWMDSHPRGTDLVIAAIYALLVAASLMAAEGVGVYGLEFTIGAGEAPATTAGPAAEAAFSWGRLATGLVCLGALLLWRRSRPWLFFAVTLAAHAICWLVTGLAVGGGAGELPILAVALYAVASRVGQRAGWAALGLLIVAEVAIQCATAFNSPSLLAAIVSILVTTLIAGLLCLYFANRRRYMAFWVERARHLEIERDQRAQLAVAEERTRIAREMHDIVSHSLTVMVSLTSGAARLVETQPARAKEAVEEAAVTGRQALADMRRMVGVLREGSATAAVLEPQPGEVDLWQLAEKFRTAGLPVALSVRGALPDDPVAVLTIYRIVQEGLTNALRYAKNPARVEAAVTVQGQAVTVEVADNGTGHDAESVGAGQGLVGLRERVALFGGTLEAGPRAEGGWRVKATLELEGAQP